MKRVLFLAALVAACTADVARPSLEAARPPAPPPIPKAVAAGATPSFSSPLGGSGQDVFRDLRIEASGSIIAVGNSLSANWPYGGSYGGWADATVVRLSGLGQFLAGTRIGAAGYERAYGVALAPDGDIVIAGRAGAGLPNLAGTFQPTFAGGGITSTYGAQDGFVCRLTPALVVEWCSYVGVNDDAIVRDVGVDTAGDIYVIAGLNKNSHNYPAQYPVAPASLPRTGNTDAVLVKVAGDGSVVRWLAYISGSGIESGTPSLALQGDTCIVAVATNSTNLPGGPLHGATDMWVAAYAPDGASRLWNHYVGGNGSEGQETNNLAVASDGTIYLGATTSSSDLPTAGSAFPVYAGSSTSGGNFFGDAAIWRISPAGVVLGAVYYRGSPQPGASGADGQEGIAVTDSAVAIAGTAMSKDLPQALQWVGFGGQGDGFVAVFSRDLTTLYRGTYVTAPGGRIDNARAVAMAPNRLVVAGWSESGWPVINPLQPFGGAQDATLVIW